MALRLVPTVLLCCATVALTACGANGRIQTVDDPFTGRQRSFARYLDVGHYTAVGMSEGQGKFSVQVLVVQRGQVRSMGRVGDQLLFKLGDEVLTLTASTEATPVTNATTQEIFTQWMVVCEPTREQLAAFSRAPLTAVKVAVDDLWFQLEPSFADADLIRENAAVLLESPPAP